MSVIVSFKSPRSDCSRSHSNIVPYIGRRAMNTHVAQHLIYDMIIPSRQFSVPIPFFSKAHSLAGYFSILVFLNVYSYIE